MRSYFCPKPNRGIRWFRAWINFRLNLPDPVDVDQVPAVYTHKPVPIQSLLESGERLPLGIRSAPRMHRHVIPVRVDSVNIGDVQDVLSIEFADNETFCRHLGCGHLRRQRRAAGAGIQPEPVSPEGDDPEQDHPLRDEVLAILIEPIRPPAAEFVLPTEQSVRQIAQGHHAGDVNERERQGRKQLCRKIALPV